MHVNLLMLRPPKDVPDPMSLATAQERVLLERAARHEREGAAYMKLQMTNTVTGVCALRFAAWLVRLAHREVS